MADPSVTLSIKVMIPRQNAKQLQGLLFFNYSYMRELKHLESMTFFPLLLIKQKQTNLEHIKAISVRYLTSAYIFAFLNTTLW